MKERILRLSINMEFYEDAILEQLPERVKPPRTFNVDFTSTQVEVYVREVVEKVEPLADEAFLNEIMTQLYRNHIEPPVTDVCLSANLKSMYTNARVNFLMKHHCPLLPRLLSALNGPSRVVPVHILAEAARREKIISSMVEGWGVYEPPTAATAWRLLVSSGLSPDMLPAYTTLTKGYRERLMDAWERACVVHGWDPVQHPKDVRAMRLKDDSSFSLDVQ